MIARLLAVAVVIALGALAACSDAPRPSSTVDAAIDAAIDMAPDPCARCGASQLCVARYDGVCQATVVCVNRTVDCPGNMCSPACRSAYCGAEYYQCETRTRCGSEPPLAFTCYGP